MESISSKNIILGAHCLALAKISLTAFSESPTYLLNSSGPLTAKKFNPEGYVTKAHSVTVAINALETQPITPAKALVVLSENYTDFKDIPQSLAVTAAKAEIIGITAKVPKKEKIFKRNKVYNLRCFWTSLISFSYDTSS